MEARPEEAGGNIRDRDSRQNSTHKYIRDRDKVAG